MEKGRRIVIVANGTQSRVFIDGKVYAESIYKYCFKHERGEEPSLEATMDWFGTEEHEGDLDSFKAFLNDTLKPAESKYTFIANLNEKEIFREAIKRNQTETSQMSEQQMNIIDETIQAVCNKIKKEDLLPDIYAQTVKALADLVEANALYQRIEDQKSNQKKRPKPV